MNNFLEDLRKNWIFITFIASTIIWGATLGIKVASLESEVALLKSNNKEFLLTLKQIEIDVAIVRTKIENLK